MNQYVNNLLECEVITNSENIDDLISKSAVVISAPSTLSFKPIQLGIPTVLIKGGGQIGKFEHYPGLVDLNKQHQLLYQKTKNWICETRI